MPDKEWMSKYEKIKEQLNCSVDLETYFTEKQIAERDVDVMEIGKINFPTGLVVACDPLCMLGVCSPYMQTIPVGTYSVKICVVPSEKYGDRYSCVKLEVSGNKPVRYEIALTGKEDLDTELEEDQFFGFGVDAGMGCIVDLQTQDEFDKYTEMRSRKNKDYDPYYDFFCDALEKSYAENPKYQQEGGDWAIWTVPETNCNIPIFHSGWGDGAYPCYFGYDENNAVCGVYILFIDIEREYEDLEIDY